MVKCIVYKKGIGKPKVLFPITSHYSCRIRLVQYTVCYQLSGLLHHTTVLHFKLQWNNKPCLSKLIHRISFISFILQRRDKTRVSYKLEVLTVGCSCGNYSILLLLPQHILILLRKQEGRQDSDCIPLFQVSQEVEGHHFIWVLESYARKVITAQWMKIARMKSL